MGKSALANVILEPGFDPALVAPGDQLDLVADGDTLKVVANGKKSVGAVEPKLARRVLKFMAGGNQYAALGAPREEDSLRIILPEADPPAHFPRPPSFPARNSPESPAPAQDSP